MPENEGYKPTEAMANAARRGLELRRKNNGKGGTAVGVARARDIANKKNLSLQTVKRMYSFFSRHRGNEKPSPGQDKEKDKGYIAFLLWGGEPGRNWSKRIVERIDKTENDMSVLDKIYRPEFVECTLGSIDIDKGLLLGVKVIQMGQINDTRPYFVDEETLRQVVELGNQSPKGIKVRYTHAEHGDAMGSHLGRATNFRIEGDSVRADITFARSAYVSPKGNLAGYVMSLAEEDSESLGMSVAGMLNTTQMSDESDADDMPLRFYELYSADVVAEPAATRNGIFSVQEEDDMKEELGVKVEVSVDDEKKRQSEMEEHTPKPVEAEAHDGPEKGEADVDKEGEMKEHYGDPEDKMSEGEDKPMVAEEESVEDKLEEDEEDMKSEKKPIAAAAKLFVEHFGHEGAMWYLEGRDISECFSEKIKQQNKELEELKEQLAKFNALVDAGAFALGEDAPVTQSVELSSEEQKAQENESKRLELAKKGLSGSDARWAQAWNF